MPEPTIHRTRTPTAEPRKRDVAHAPAIGRLRRIPKALSFAAGLESIVKSSEHLTERVQELAREVRVTLAIPTLCGEPIQAQRGRLSADNYERFRPEPATLQSAVKRAAELGLTIVRQGRFGVTVAGPLEMVEEVCRTKLAVASLSHGGQQQSVRSFTTSLVEPRAHDLFLAPLTSLTLPAEVSDHIDNFVFTPPPLYFTPKSDPPAHTWYGLDEAAVRSILSVPADADGAGVRIAIVDSGFYNHPFFAKRAYALRPTTTNSSPAPESDDEGHGTAMAANIFATAPKAEVLGIKQSNPPQDAIEEAAELGVDIISCSWGYDREAVFPILQATIIDIIAEGRVLLFASGNGHNAWPASQPEVLAVGGVYSDPSGNLEASNFASGFLSSVFPGRSVPDVCCLCGQLPKAIYFMLPTQPGCQLDRANSGAGQDGTSSRDGWVGCSGTSAATPQAAGVVALLIQRARSKGVPMTPGLVRDALQKSARAVGKGVSANGAAASGQPNTATGWGLIDASAALALV